MSQFRVLVVCTGNVHRSAFAAALLREWAQWYLPDNLAPRFVVGSAGTRAAVGARMAPPVRALVAGLIGSEREHRAAQLSDQVVASADLVLVASRKHRDAVLERVPAGLRRTFTIREAGRIADVLGPRSAPGDVEELRAVVAAIADRRADVIEPSADDIADPEGQGESAFALMAAEELPPLVAVARVLLGMPDADARAYLEAAENPARGVSPQ